MKLEVLIRRQGYDEPDAGLLRAWVVQHGVRSNVNLLAGRQVGAVWRAQSYIEGKLATMYGPVEISWVGIGEQQAAGGGA